MLRFFNDQENRETFKSCVACWTGTAMGMIAAHYALESSPTYRMLEGLGAISSCLLIGGYAQTATAMVGHGIPSYTGFMTIGVGIGILLGTVFSSVNEDIESLGTLSG